MKGHLAGRRVHVVTDQYGELVGTLLRPVPSGGVEPPEDPSQWAHWEVETSLGRYRATWFGNIRRFVADGDS